MKNRLAIITAAALISTQTMVQARPALQQKRSDAPTPAPLALLRSKYRPHQGKRERERRRNRTLCPLCRQPPGECHPACIHGSMS